MYVVIGRPGAATRLAAGRRRSGKCRSRNAINARSSGECARPRFFAVRRERGSAIVSPSSRYRATMIGCTYDFRQIAGVFPAPPNRGASPARRSASPRFRCAPGQLGEDRRGAQRPAPRAKILGAEPSDAYAASYSLTSRELIDTPLFARSDNERAERPGVRNWRSTSFTNWRSVHDLPLPDASLPPCTRGRAGVVPDADVRFTQRRDAGGCRSLVCIVRRRRGRTSR